MHIYLCFIQYYSMFSLQTADPIITKIDPENYVMYRLYRDATHFMNGCHKKVKKNMFLSRNVIVNEINLSFLSDYSLKIY